MKAAVVLCFVCSSIRGSRCVRPACARRSWSSPSASLAFWSLRDFGMAAGPAGGVRGQRE